LEWVGYKNGDKKSEAFEVLESQLGKRPEIIKPQKLPENRMLRSEPPQKTSENKTTKPLENRAVKLGLPENRQEKKSEFIGKILLLQNGINLEFPPLQPRQQQHQQPQHQHQQPQPQQQQQQPQQQQQQQQQHKQQQTASVNRDIPPKTLPKISDNQKLRTNRRTEFTPPFARRNNTKLRPRGLRNYFLTPEIESGDLDDDFPKPGTGLRVQADSRAEPEKKTDWQISPSARGEYS